MPETRTTNSLNAEKSKASRLDKVTTSKPNKVYAFLILYSGFVLLPGGTPAMIGGIPGPGGIIAPIGIILNE